MHNPGRVFRDLLRTEPYLFTGGVYSPLDAQIAERVGMKSIYLSGYSMALANGWPDMGFLTQTEVTRIGAMVASAVEIPVIADADDGYGNALSTIRTVQEYVRSGVAGIHIEDQRLPQALRSHRGQGDHQRGSGRGEVPRGRGHPRPDESGLRHHRPHRRLRRGGRQPAGSHPPRPRVRRRRRGPGVAASSRARTASRPSPSPRRCASRTRTVPLAFNYSSSFKWHKDPNPFTFRELGELGYKFIFITLFAAHAGMYAVWNAMEELVRDQEQAQWRLEKTKDGHPTESHHVMARVSHFQELEKRYIPGSDERIKGSAGYDDKRMH